MQYSRYSHGLPPRRRRRRVRLRFFVFLAVFLALIALGVWGLVSLLGGPKLVALRYGRLEQDSAAEAIIVRNEQVIGLVAYSRVQYQATENQQVSVDDPIVITYSQSYSGQKMDELAALQRQIAAIQEERLPGVKDPNIEQFDTLIADKTAEIASFARGGREGVQIVNLERDLREYLTKRQEFIRADANISGDTELNDLYRQVKEVEMIIDSWRTVHRAEIDGRVSYIFDGYEHLLKPENMANITVEDAAGLIRSTTAPTVPPEEKDTYLPPVYRVVKPDEWYVLMSVNEKDWSFASGTKCDISFVGFEDMLFSATVNSISGTGEQALVVLGMSEDMGPLINARRVSAVLGGLVEGLMVPQSAVKTNGAAQGVYLEDAATFVPVEVLAKDEYGYALIASVESGRLTPGMPVVAR